MSTKLIKTADNQYINPRYIVAIFQRNPFQRNHIVWIVKMKDGGEYIIDDNYLGEVIRVLT